MTYTIIREGTYTDTYTSFLGFFQNTDTEVVIPANGGVPFVDWEDLGIASGEILASNDYNNKIVNLTGPKIIDMEEATKIISRIVGHEIKFKKVTLQEWLARHADKALAGTWSTAYPALENGDWEIEDPLLAKLVGKPLVTFEERARKIILGTNKSGDLNLHYNYMQ